MNPFYFGTDERRLFGIYEAAQGAPGKRAVVLCHPWGTEFIHAYRVMRQLAKMLTSAGMHVLRFDYYGTGDSAGDDTAGDPDAWEADILSAIEELKDMAETPRVSLVGLRLGAALAARVAARSRTAVDALVLWDPVVSGTDFLRELHGAARSGWQRRTPTARAREDGGGFDIAGFPLTEQMAAAIRRIDLAPLAPALPARTLVVAARPTEAPAVMRKALDRCRCEPLPVERIDGEPAWIEWPIGHPMAGAVPVAMLQRIVAWLG
jgi:exosortase A-associated hydrolase 2